MSAINDAFNGIRRLIADGTFPPNSKMPPENELCDLLGVSRGSIREAIRMLEVLNIVEVRHGSGTYVRGMSANELISSLSLTVDIMPLRSLLDAYQLRIMVESSVCEQAASNITDQQIALLRDTQTQIELCARADDSVELDALFHGTIAESSGLSTAKTFLDVLRARSSYYSLYSQERGRLIFEESNQGHRSILHALELHSPMLAKAAMAQHVECTRMHLQELLAKQEQ